MESLKLGMNKIFLLIQQNPSLIKYKTRSFREDNKIISGDKTTN